MRTTIRLTVTRPDGVPFDKAIQIEPEDSPAARDINKGMFSVALVRLSFDFDTWLDEQYGKYRPSPIEEIEKALYLAKQKGGNK